MTLFAGDQTALLFIPPSNDFVSEGVKLWPRARLGAQQVGMLANLRGSMAAVRQAGCPTSPAPR